MKRRTAIMYLLFALFISPTLMASNALLNQVIIRTPLLTAHFAQEKSIERIEIKRITFAPRQKTGMHLHPCPVVGYIAKGSIYFQVEGSQAKMLYAGEAFFEPANTNMLYFDNPSKTKESTFLTFYLLSKKDKQIIKMLK